MGTDNGMVTGQSHRSRKAQALSLFVIVTLIFGMLMLAAEASPVSAATAKTKVTLTINMGKSGSSCPTLYFKEGSKTAALGQVVSKWYIDGKYAKDPWSKFYKKGWDFGNHKIKVVMSVKVPKGKYKVVLDNGKKTKTLYKKLSVSKKAVKKSVSF
jgi:hypothetical protein